MPPPPPDPTDSTLLPPHPEWLLRAVDRGQRHADDTSLMQLAIRVAQLNVENTDGGPFGTVIATAEGDVIAIGYNQVVPLRDSTAHAEVQAIRRAEQALGTYSLRGEGVPPLRLFTSCAPCVQCTGAIHWAGVPEVIAAARTEDAEAVGFIEGPTGFDLAAFLQSRGIRYRADLLREEAAAVLRGYGGPIYQS